MLKKVPAEATRHGPTVGLTIDMGAGKKGEEMQEALQGVQAEVAALEKEEAELLAQLARAQASLSAARARKVSHTP